MREIAKEADCSLRAMYDYLHRREEKWTAAKVASSEALLDKAEDALLDEKATKDSAHASVHRSRSEYYKWLAKCRNRKELGDNPQIAIGIVDASDLHLDALRQFGSAKHYGIAAPKKVEEEVPLADYAVVEEDVGLL
jgi:AcrR family transcriptional regulator